MTAPAICQRINEFCEFLSLSELALNIQSHVVKELEAGKRRVTWTSVENTSSRQRYDDVRFSEYLSALRERDFSVLMYDGSILQISLDYNGGNLVGHRHVFLPCPIHFQPSDLHGGDSGLIPLEDFIEDITADEFQDRLRVRPPLRFEYDPEAATEDHPASHVHLGQSRSRIAVSSPLSSDRFLRFIFRNFYPDEFTAHPEIHSLTSPAHADTISEMQAGELHVRVGS